MNSKFKPLTAAKPKKKQPPQRSDNVIESLRNVGSDVGKTLTKDGAATIATDALTSLLGARPRSGELRQNEAVQVQPEARPVPRHRPETLRPAAMKREEIGLKEQIEAVRAELKALSASLKGLHQEVQKAVEDVPVNPGVYHVTFYERLRSVLILLKTQVDDSRMWLSAWTSRKKKQGYWAQYKKKGTKFGLSSERTPATQSG